MLFIFPNIIITSFYFAITNAAWSVTVYCIDNNIIGL